MNKNILISREDWDNIQETLYILSIPGMRESLIKARRESFDECVEQLDW